MKLDKRTKIMLLALALVILLIVVIVGANVGNVLSKRTEGLIIIVIAGLFGALIGTILKKQPTNENAKLTEQPTIADTPKPKQRYRAKRTITTTAFEIVTGLLLIGIWLLLIVKKLYIDADGNIQWADLTFMAIGTIGAIYALWSTYRPGMMTPYELNSTQANLVVYRNGITALLLAAFGLIHVLPQCKGSYWGYVVCIAISVFVFVTEALLFAKRTRHDNTSASQDSSERKLTDEVPVTLDNSICRIAVAVILAVAWGLLLYAHPIAGTDKVISGKMMLLVGGVLSAVALMYNNPAKFHSKWEQHNMKQRILSIRMDHVMAVEIALLAAFNLMDYWLLILVVTYLIFDHLRNGAA